MSKSKKPLLIVRDRWPGCLSAFMTMFGYMSGSFLGVAAVVVVVALSIAGCCMCLLIVGNNLGR